jgi:ATP-binding cassette subfamily F protein 3
MDILPAEARNLLGRFLLSGDDVYRPIRTLSGGEKNKLSLARLTHLRPNLLVLDEPTNHLDMASREALAEILKEYQGTLVLISHDRWLLNQVTDQTLDVRKSGPIIYPGSYAEYRRRQDREQNQASVAAKPFQVAAGPTLSPRELSKEIGRIEKLIEQIEGAIDQLEKSKIAIEAKLADVGPADDVVALSNHYQQIDLSLAEKLAEWESESERIETLRAMQGK